MSKSYHYRLVISIDKERTNMNNFKTNIKFHNELRACANATYKKRGYTIPSEYKIEKDVQNSYTGFTALVLKKGNSIIIAYGGTHDIKDLNADFQMTKKIVPTQFMQAEELYKNCAKEYKNYKIFTTGDSLGGSMSQYVSAKFNVPSVTFNAYGVKNLLKEPISTATINYCNKGDLINSLNAQNHIGECFELNTDNESYSPFILGDHLFTNQKPITQQVPIKKDDLKKWNEVEDAKNNVKKIFENLSSHHNFKTPSIDDAINNYILENAHNHKFLSKMLNSFLDNYYGNENMPQNINGQVFVKQYSRDDGTNVRAHWRDFPHK